MWSHQLVRVTVAVVLAVPVAGSAYASAAVANSHPGVGAVTERVAGAASQRPAARGFEVFRRPVARYTRHSCVIDLSKFDDWSMHSKLRGCGETIRFSSPFMRMTVPETWAGLWPCPPLTESCQPHVMYSDHVDTATIDFAKTVFTGGFEYEPAEWQVERITVSFFAGPKGSGSVVGSITRDVNGKAGARLFAARTTTGFRSIVVTNNSSDDFAIAQVRVHTR